jgi:hypothetical protein
VAVVERVSTESRQLEIRRILLTALAAPLWLLGFLSGKAWLAILWLCVAVKVGWMDARAASRRR